MPDHVQPVASSRAPAWSYRGYALAFASSFLGAVGTVWSKWLIEETSAKTTAVMWYVVGTLVTGVALILSRGRIDLSSIRRNFRVYMIISLVMSAGATAWFLGVGLAGPSIVAFVSQLGIVLGVLLGTLVLGERMKPIEAAGGLLAVAGALAITYRASHSITLGVLFTLMNSLAVAIQNVMVKRHLREIDKLELIFVRSVTATVTIFAYSMIVGGLVRPKTWHLPAFFFGSVVGYVAVNFLLYQALARIDLAKVSILSVVAPPTVMLGSYLAFGDVPGLLQIAGSVLILAGVSIILVQPAMARRQHSP